VSTTIVAIASPPGPAQRGILRLSGPEARALVDRVLVEPRPALAEGDPRRVLSGRLDDGGGTQPVQVLWMPGPHSYTREDVAELHLPGAEPLLRRALARLLELGATAAAPGEFTRRAFLNGRIDLSEAEGVLEVVHATGEAERRAGLRLLTGGLSRRVEGLRDRLDEVRALCEASLDFDEADTGHVPEEELLAGVDGIAGALEEALGWEVARQPPSTLPRVFLYGAPNAGKSSLFNALVEDGRTLVSDLAGTTRDSVVGVGRLAAGTVLLVDAPGLDPGARGPDATAQRLAEGERLAADALLWVVDATRAPAPPEDERAALPAGVPVLLAWTQSDRAGAHPLPQELDGVATSAVTGEGLAGLSERLGVLLGLGPRAGAASSVLFERHRRGLVEARESVGRARTAVVDGVLLDLVAELLREAGAALDAITGRTTPEDLFDRIFARFCIGK
jgi:tRNA modification GTPase